MKNIAKKVSEFYMSRTKREKFMLYAFIIAGLGLWYTNLADKSALLEERMLDLSARLDAARMVVASEESIVSKLAEARKAFDKSKTVSARALQDMVEKSASESSLQYETSLPQSSEGNLSGGVSVSTLRFSAQHAPIGNLVEFERKLKRLEPYAVVKEASFSADGKGLVNARYKICSFDFPNQTEK